MYVKGNDLYFYLKVKVSKVFNNMEWHVKVIKFLSKLSSEFSLWLMI